ncbi:MAG: hypothetical protein JNK30_18335 [Phenylobacterium sp.]|uniref:hypothetical protein n=1 Tax=Phenylobacterium sp. TaxID=1871053 RepID=UPI001A590EBD|nr:hypothetical protein [Phenylobacterium sp.]MBL8773348.1 hypothetical protein [Phenylobacterium sp.]
MMEVALIEAAKRQARLDLLKVMVAQAGVNAALSTAVARMAMGQKISQAELVQITNANDAVLKLLDEWLKEREGELPDG